MKKAAHLKIPVRQFVDCEYHLQNNTPFEGQGDKYAVWKWSVNFGDGMEVDINVYNGLWDSYLPGYGPPWVDVILFRDGHEVCFCEPDESIFGEWTLLDTNCDEYTVIIGITNKEELEVEHEHLESG